MTVNRWFLGTPINPVIKDDLEVAVKITGSPAYLTMNPDDARLVAINSYEVRQLLNGPMIREGLWVEREDTGTLPKMMHGVLVVVTPDQPPGKARVYKHVVEGVTPESSVPYEIDLLMEC